MEMDDNYEKGYQDGVMDAEEELLKAFKTSTSVSVTREDSLGYSVATMTIRTTGDSTLYDLIMRYAQSKTIKLTESVVPKEPDVRYSLSAALQNNGTAHIGTPIGKKSAGVHMHRGSDLQIDADAEMDRIHKEFQRNVARAVEEEATASIKTP